MHWNDIAVAGLADDVFCVDVLHRDSAPGERAIGGTDKSPRRSSSGRGLFESHLRLLGLPEDLGDFVDLGDQVVGNCDIE
jgi:hypothetical protein